jgi:hypothetical protein
VTWEGANAGLGDVSAYGLAISPDFARDRTLYAATAAGLFRSRDGAASWDAVVGEGLTGAVGAIAVGPEAGGKPGLLLTVTLDGELFASEDAGETWRPIGVGFGGASVVTLAISPGFAKDHTIFAGTREPYNDGSGDSLLVLWRSTDGGGRWHHWLEERGRSALPLAVPPGYLGDGALYVGLDGRVAKPIRNTWRRGGAERLPVWTGVDLLDSEGKPAAITALATSPHYRQDNTVFASTSAGIYLSRDGGRTFAPWSGGMGASPVVAIAVTPKGASGQWVFALGLGGSVWRRRVE